MRNCLCGMYDPHLADATAFGLRSGDTVPNTQGLITVGPYKIITDGSLGSQTACCHHSYPGDPTNFGIFAYETPKLADMLRTAIDGGFQLAIHAIGDKANSLTLETLASLPSPPLSGSTIEHAQLLDHADIPLFKRLGLVASVQPVHMVDDRELCEQFWAGRTARSFPFRSLVEAGVELRMGSDAPVAPVDPWDAIAVAVSRTSAGNEHLPGWHPEQCISHEVAWAASTSNGRIGLAVGDRADLIILDRDPLTSDAKQLRAMVVKGTMLGGRWTHFAL